MGKLKKGADRYYRDYLWYNGKQYSVRATTERKLKAKLREKLQALESTQVILSPETTVTLWFEKWNVMYKERNKKAGDAQKQLYKSNFKNHIEPVIGDMKLCEVLPIHLEEIMNNQLTYSQDHINKVYNLLGQLFRAAHINKLIASNPAEGVEKPNVGKPEGSGHRAITESERAYILQLAETHRAGLWILTLLYCGLRPQETVPLRKSNIDFKRQKLMIFEALKAGTNDVIGGPKSKHGRREIPIPDTLFDKFKSLNIGPYDYLFTQPTTGRMMTRTSMRCMWLNFKRELDIRMGTKVYRNQIIVHAVADDLVPYCFRHTYCTDLKAAGVSKEVAVDLMGHGDDGLINDVYMHKSEIALDDAAEKINSFANRMSTKDKISI